MRPLKQRSPQSAEVLLGGENITYGPIEAVSHNPEEFLSINSTTQHQVKVLLSHGFKLRVSLEKAYQVLHLRSFFGRIKIPEPRSAYMLQRLQGRDLVRKSPAVYVRPVWEAGGINNMQGNYLDEGPHLRRVFSPSRHFCCLTSLFLGISQYVHRNVPGRAGRRFRAR